MSKTIRAEYMTRTQRNAIDAVNSKTPRTHRNMIAATGVARPGKSASDRANKMK